jgi:hypothetical protein
VNLVPTLAQCSPRQLAATIAWIADQHVHGRIEEQDWYQRADARNDRKLGYVRDLPREVSAVVVVTRNSPDVDDAAMLMFTVGQVERTHAAFAGPRKSFA